MYIENVIKDFTSLKYTTKIKLLILFKGGDKMEDESMSKEEMQRFLIKEAQRGSTEIEAYRNLMEIIGIEYPKEKENKTS